MAVAALEVLKERFSKRYPASSQPSIYRAPGRVNLIGEHTDYNLGFVMPIALDMACYAAVAPGNSGGGLRLYSEDLQQGREWPAFDFADAKPSKEWTDYVVGVAQQLSRAGMKVQAADLLIHSTVPVGAGLSSSAALEVASALALSNGATTDKLELAKLCRRAENEFVGMPCGLMDQFISVYGKAHRAIKLDCRSLEYEEVPLPENVAILAVNSMVKHELGASAYRQRVAECGEAVAAMKRRHPEVTSLRDATVAMLDDVSGVPQRRAQHIVSENQRVLDFAAAGRQADRKRMGELFLASHRSLQHDYEVSCPELDFLVDAALGIDGVFGSRMTGGGFGGCTVNLVEPARSGEFKAKIREKYLGQYAIEPQIYECSPSDGAGQIIF